MLRTGSDPAPKFVSRRHAVNFAADKDYHGSSFAAAIPFSWESQPGTPKVRFPETPLPPLTPPPSYFYSASKRPITKRSKPDLLDAIFLKCGWGGGTRIIHNQTSPCSSSSSSSSPPSSRPSYSAPSSPAGFGGRYGVSKPIRFSFDSKVVDEEERVEYGSPISTQCFGRGGHGVNATSSRGCFSSVFKVFVRDFQ